MNLTQDAILSLRGKVRVEATDRQTDKDRKEEEEKKIKRTKRKRRRKGGFGVAFSEREVLLY